MAVAVLHTGISMFYDVVGSGEPLVFISGQNTDHTQWRTVTPFFSDAYRTIVFDNRGTGETSKPIEPYSMQGFADDTVALLDTLSIDRAHFVGASMGGKIAQWVAINYPQRVASMTLMATTPGGPLAVDWTPEVARAMKSAPTGDGTSDPIVPFLISEAWAAKHADFAQLIAERRVNPGGAQPRRLHFQASGAHDAWNSLPSIATPVLVLHGQDDQMSPLRNAELLQERIPGAQLVVIEHGRHEFFIEFPEQSLQAIRRFLEQHPLLQMVHT